MFETHVGPVAGEGSEVYLRPETAQGIFINFKNVLGFARKKPPFGIAQIGKSFRNEITPGNFIFRTREFEQMEMEFFVPPADAESWYQELDRGARALVHRPRHPPRPPARPPPRRRRALPLLLGDQRRRVPLPDRLVGAGGDRQPRRLRPHPARQVQRREARVLRPADQRALRPPRDRARRRRRPRHPRLPRRRLRGRGGRGPPAHRAAPAPAPGPGQGRRPPPRLQGGHAGEGPRDLRGACAAACPPSSTRAARSASATAARTRSAPPGASPSTTRRWKTTPSPSATATPWSRPGSRSRASPTSWSAASNQPWRSPKLG